MFIRGKTGAIHSRQKMSTLHLMLVLLLAHKSCAIDDRLLALRQVVVELRAMRGALGAIVAQNEGANIIRNEIKQVMYDLQIQYLH